MLHLARKVFLELAPFPQPKYKTVPALRQHNNNYVRIKGGHPFGKTELTVETTDQTRMLF